MDIADLELLPGACYAFRYPNLEDSLDLRRFRYEGTAHRSTGVYLVGVDLDSGHEGKWSPEMITRVEQIEEPQLIPHRTYAIRHEGVVLSLYVFSVFPAEGDFRVTGRVGGRFFAGWLSELGIGVAT